MPVYSRASSLLRCRMGDRENMRLRLLWGMKLILGPGAKYTVYSG